ncbi:hypothetical protein AB0B45_50570 [Nonomuraea sp. NPDC049152]|uniref:hypothetical protein n=1 Tax=Nonomuraea sp. NPDC049152 TaxID=3154350 RepID=UPI00340677EB
MIARCARRLPALRPAAARVTCFLGTLEGTFAGTPFAMRLRYTRTWVHTDEHGWRILAAHASPA